MNNVYLSIFVKLSFFVVKFSQIKAFWNGNFAFAWQESHTDNNEVLMSALAAMQDKTAHLENSLSAETKIKMELFSALGEVKRQMEIQRRKLHQVLDENLCYL